MTLRSAETHYQERAALAALVGRRVRQLWARVPASDVNAWRSLHERAAGLVVAGQYAAARSAEEYVAGALAEQGSRVPTEARVAAAGFAGMANGPVTVPELIDLPRIQALTAIGQGAPAGEALVAAGARLQTYAVSLVQDAGRQADSVAIAVRPKTGYRRMVNPPCCADCAILAGKWFKYNTGFERHPNCDCQHIPAAEDAPGNVSTDPDVLFGSGQVTGLSEAERQAVADGADPAQVVNARRGRTADKMFTTEGTTRRGVASRRIRESRPGVPEQVRNAGRRGYIENYQERRVVRPTPDAIYKYAESRDDALELLRRNGYIL
jgi:hypothetical protein